MNLSHRSKLSLCQFLMLFGRDELIPLFGKFGLSTYEIENQWVSPSVAGPMRQAILWATTTQLGELVQELARTHNSMRAGVTPRYRFDERWKDLRLCLELDGYAKERDECDSELNRFVPTEPIIEDAAAVEDDLTKEIRRSGLDDTEGILRVLDSSATAFLNDDFNGSLNNARVALQTLATSIAQARLPSQPGSFDSTKWGQVLTYLRTSCFITEQQEKGVAGVFSLISPGSHTPIGFSEKEFARLGRGFALSTCYFLVRLYGARKA